MGDPERHPRGPVPAFRRRAPRVARSLAPILAILGLLAARGLSPGQVRLTQEEAIRVAFPAAESVERRTAFLSDAQLDSVRDLAGSDVQVKQRVVTYYVALQGDEPLGVAYFDAHRVRTLPEVLMIVVTPGARISRIEVLSFSEPPEYRAPKSWLDQFDGMSLSDELSLKGAIVNITGATLTARAVTRAGRRVLALHRLIRPFEEAERGERRDR